ncbi:MAG: SGNH/GDSL hydrolase family protein [Sandaracinaceae bacterium]
MRIIEMNRAHRAIVLALSLLAIACDDGMAGDGGLRDGGTASDAGPRGDGGPRTDAGPRRDGSVGTDAGVDGGGPPLADVHFLGRFEIAAMDDARFAWPGSSVRARFDGTAISVTLEDGGNGMLDVEIDGTVVDVLTPSGGSGTYELASGLAAGQHDVAITRRTESFFGATRFRGFSGATLVPSPAPARFIEMVGDSITCGYGVLGPNESCGFSADTEAETHAWGAIAAADLDAAHVAIAYSGKGVVRNYGGDTSDRLPQIYDRVFADDGGTTYGFDQYTPDVVVINLGTNDYSVGDPGMAFEDQLATFVGVIRGHYPDAWIILATSPMLGGADHAAHLAHLQSVDTALGDARVDVLDLAPQDGGANGLGCDYHPSEATQAIMATALAARIRMLTGW